MARLRISLIASLAMAAVLGVTGCSGCNKKSSSRPAPAAITPTPEPEPAPAPEPGPTPNPSVGEETPPITNDSPASIDTDAGASVKHLIFETSASTEAGRYLSEYIIVVRANEDSCVRIKVRPTDGVTDEVDTSAFQGGVQGTEACAGEGYVAPPEPAPATTSEADPEGASLRGTRPFAPELAWATAAEQEKRRGLSLTTQSAALCSPRLFRMETIGANGTTGLSPVISKTGLLRVVGQKVRIWVDEEFYPGCNANATAGTLASPSFYFGPLIQAGMVPTTWRDALYMDHLQNLAAEMDKIATSIQTDFGPVSDIDDSKYVEIFLSPDVNRKYFDNIESVEVDSFQAGLIYRPEDLAYYDAKGNPTSNEGEILYLWTPDPAGIYNQRQYPTANSISSNFAKGYLAAQTMTLIVANQRLLQQEQKNIPDSWLVSGLAMLASSYYAGNDYSWRAIAQYMTSRPQYISLTEPPDSKLLGPRYMAMAQHEALGMRTLFAWYMHSRLCGSNTVAPCTALKSLVTSTKTGVEAVEELLSLSFKDLTANFALSVGVSMIEHPDAAMAFWDAKPLPASMPLKPTLMPDLTEVRPNDVPVTIEATNTGGVYAPPAVSPATPNGHKDRTVAGPFPSKDVLIFQALAADNDMEFKVAKNSVTYLMVTGLIDPSTDMTAYFGKGLNVVFVPIGERDGDLRRIHIEKLSESAHSDLRPDNLTSRNADSNSTYLFDPTYDSLDFTVNPQREIWTLGSIDNYRLNVAGEMQDMRDSDAYNIEFLPCEGLTGAELTTCQGKEHSAWVQVTIRDFDKELQPMLMVTEADRGIFRGVSIYDRMTRKVPSWEGDEDAICQSEASWPSFDVTVTFPSTFHAPGNTLQNGDKVFFGSDASDRPTGVVRNVTYTVANAAGGDFELVDLNGRTVVMSGDGETETHWISNGSRGVCANGGVSGMYVFDHSLTALNPLLYAHNYDNFLQLGSYGFPFTTRNTQTYKDEPPCTGYMCYDTNEAYRQQMIFKFDKTVLPNLYHFYAGPRFTASFDNLVRLEPSLVSKAVSVKSTMDQCPANPVPGDNPTSEAFLDECGSVPGLSSDLCTVLCTNLAFVESQVIDKFAGYFMACVGGTCTQEEQLLIPGVNTRSWMPSSQYFWAVSTSNYLNTYYEAIEPYTTDTYCGGDAIDTGGYYPICSVKAESIPDYRDIRQQMNVKLSEMSYLCMTQLIGTDFKLCYDPLSLDQEFDPEDSYAYWTVSNTLPTDRNAQLPPSTYTSRRTAPIYSRAGEVIAKPERLNAVLFRVPGTGAVANIIVGGRQMSQGKYLLRARLMSYP